MSYLDQLKTPAEVHKEIAAAAKQRRLALNITQDDLSERSGVSLATLRRFEAGGAASLATVLAVAEALDTLDAFTNLFPPPEAQTLDDLEAAPQRLRARPPR